MNTHFLHTAGGFSYPYYLAVLSALRTQSGKVTVWSVNDDGKYLEVLKSRFPGRLTIELLSMPFTDIPPALVGHPENWVHTHVKDYLIWVILAAHGGLCLDLDTFCLADCADLLGDKQIMLPMDYPTPAGSKYPYNSAIVAVPPNSPIAIYFRDEAFKRLTQRKAADFPWGTTGPILVSEFAQQHPEIIAVPHWRVCGGFGGTESTVLWKNDSELAQDVRVIHLFAQHNYQLFRDITPDNIAAGLHLLARIVRKTLTGQEIIPLISWDVGYWLRNRGVHYVEMFRYLRTHNCRNILEIGTHSGDNAIGMIHTSLASESSITYYGFDLFKPHNAAIQALEFSRGYHNPPPCAAVEASIRLATRANCILFTGNSREILPKANLPKMDYIYLDGGHSLETVASDFACAERLLAPGGIIFLDDYFSEVRHVGCAVLIDSLDRGKYRVQVYPETDDYAAPNGRLRTQLASVQLIGG